MIKSQQNKAQQNLCAYIMEYSVYLRGMLVNIGSVDSLLIGGTKSLPEPKLTYYTTRTNFSELWIKTWLFSIHEINFKMSST